MASFGDVGPSMAFRSAGIREDMDWTGLGAQVPLVRRSRNGAFCAGGLDPGSSNYTWILQLCLPNLAGCVDEKAELLRSWKIHIGP